MNGTSRSGQITFYSDSISLETGLLPLTFTAYTLSETTQTYTLTGNANNLLYGYSVSLTVGTFSETNNPISLIYTPLNTGIGNTRGSVLAITLNLNL